ncbi:hypothetical protein FRC19_002968 [Serendipita sp. 401]|nr:hypothetical protein FRC18_002947 [Serendipita sp. 400]KAG8812728.1 hypothetical protein FRC19_002968 [Serendipita sp. 401]KAG9042516.1 hypothetical protein FS842_002164 [Serendipita sp. 407]
MVTWFLADIIPCVPDDYTIIDPPREGATTTILDLPIELLHKIINYCKFADIVALSTVCRYSYTVCFDRVYSLVPIYVRASKLPWADTLKKEANVDEILPYLSGRYFTNITRLLRRPEHRHALQTLLICDVPSETVNLCSIFNEDHRRAILSTLVREIISRAPNLQHLVLPKNAPNLTEVIWPNSLKSLKVYTTGQDTRRAFRTLNGLERFSVVAGVDIASVRSIPLRFGQSIQVFSCTWRAHVLWRREIDAYITILGNFAQYLADAMPSLKCLEIGIVEDFVPDLQHDQERMIKAKRQCYLNIVEKLAKIQDFTLLTFTNDFLYEHNTPIQHWEFVRRLGTASRTLDCIQLRDPGFRHSNNVLKELNIVWKRAHVPSLPSPVAPACTTTAESMWTPDPTRSYYWGIWFREFGTAEEVQRMMKCLWTDEQDVPYLHLLKLREPSSTVS